MNNYKQYIDKISENLNAIIPVEWDKIYFLGDVWTGRTSSSCVFYFVESETEKIIRYTDISEKYNINPNIITKNTEDLYTILLDLYDSFVENNQEPWTFVRINWTDKDSCKYCFDFCNRDELGWERMRSELIWAYETFGKLPREGTYQKRVLDKFINSGEKSPFQNELS
jgi:uncharacterized protein (TIGR01741 family)